MSPPRALAIVSLVAAMGACDRDAPPRREVPPAPVASVARALGLDAGDLEPPVDPPAPEGDFAAELAAFTTVDACVAQRAGLDPAVGDALEAIGYDTLVRDACRVLDAARSQNARRCASIDASSLRERCVALVAELASSPDDCPFEIPTRPERGRQPACLAIATHDARLCAAAFDAPSRVTCAALLSRDDSGCKHLALTSDQRRCARDEHRFAAVLPKAEAAPQGALSSHGKATLAGEEAGVDLSRGIVVVEQIDGAHAVLGSFSEAMTSFLVPSPDAGATVGVELVVPLELKKAHVERLVVERPGKPATRIEGSAARALTVVVTKLEKRRGGAVEVTVDGKADEGTPVHVEARTFVRDVVSARDLLGARGFGDAGPLR
ncbi:MAG: hypothetical protein ACRELB_15960 [Polyangiaceae bacterium]